MAIKEPKMARSREQWSGQMGFIFAAIGSAVGLGNIWRFPGVAYENGGGAFILPYLIALLTAGIPILFVDYALGHRYRGTPPTAFRRIRKWAEGFGWFQVAICLVIILYYAVIVAWAGSFAFFSLDLKWGDDSTGFFYNTFLQMPEGDAGFGLEFIPGILWPLIGVWVITLVILGFGVQKGVEKANFIFLPLLILLFVALVLRSLFLPGAMDGLNAFFTPNWGALGDPKVWLAAYAQIFFSLSIAFGIMITYSSYIKKRANLTGPGLVVGFANSSFEMLAGIGVFSTLGFMAQQQNVSVAELEDIQGVALSFVTFPHIVSTMPGGQIFGLLFFGSLFFAGLTSLLSLLQVVSGAFQEKLNISPRQSALWVGGAAAAVSVFLFARTDALLTLDAVDKWANEVGIVFSAIVMLTLLLVLKMFPVLQEHLNASSSFKVGKGWQIFVSYIVPVLLIIMFVIGLIALLKEQHNGNPAWFNGVFGWGSIGFMIVFATVMSVVKWRIDPDNFTPEPAIAGEKIDAKAFNASGKA